MSQNNDDKVTIFDPSCNNPPLYLDNGTEITRPWARTQGTTCFNDCTTQEKCFSIEQQNMRRKAEVLKYNSDSSLGFSKKQIYSMISKGKYTTKSQNNAVSNTNDYTKSGNVLFANKSCESKNYGYASQNNVPGNKNFKIELDEDVPLTHYPSIQRTFKSAQESWPETRWESTKEGFAVGKSGSAHPYITSSQIIGNLYEH